MDAIEPCRSMKWRRRLESNLIHPTEQKSSIAPIGEQKRSAVRTRLQIFGVGKGNFLEPNGGAGVVRARDDCIAKRLQTLHDLVSRPRSSSNTEGVEAASECRRISGARH